jgi:hypothetical protein
MWSGRAPKAMGTVIADIIGDIREERRMTGGSTQLPI